VSHIARQNIAIGEALAYTRGQRVEDDAVKANRWEDLVAPEDSKEAAAIRAEITGQPAETKTTPAARAGAKPQEG
jgi:hypothetical protein